MCQECYKEEEGAMEVSNRIRLHWKLLAWGPKERAGVSQAKRRGENENEQHVLTLRGQGRDDGVKDWKEGCGGSRKVKGKEARWHRMKVEEDGAHRTYSKSSGKSLIILSMGATWQIKGLERPYQLLCGKRIERIVFWVVLRFEFRASCLRGRRPTTWAMATPQPHYMRLLL